MWLRGNAKFAGSRSSSAKRHVSSKKSEWMYQKNYKKFIHSNGAGSRDAPMPDAASLLLLFPSLLPNHSLLISHHHSQHPFTSAKNQQTTSLLDRLWSSQTIWADHWRSALLHLQETCRKTFWLLSRPLLLTLPIHRLYQRVNIDLNKFSLKKTSSQFKMLSKGSLGVIPSNTLLLG